VSDIYLSYSRRDSSQATALVQLLTLQGWSVYWDQKLVPGQDFDEALTEELNKARCVVVLWSEGSITSQWVAKEAYVGLSHRVLVPVRLELVNLPQAFQTIYAADLVGWNGDANDPRLIAVVGAIRALLNKQPASTPAAPASTPAPPAVPLADRVFTFSVVDPKGTNLSGATVRIYRDGKPKAEVITGDGPVTVQVSAQEGHLEVEVFYPPDFRVRQPIQVEGGSVRITIPTTTHSGPPQPHIPPAPPRRWVKWLFIGAGSVAALGALIWLLIALMNRDLLPVGRSPFDVKAAYVGAPPHTKPVAVVFVHGIFGDQSTWEYQKSSFPQLLASDPQFESQTDVFVFEYYSPHFGSAASVQGLAQQLRGSLEDSRVFENHEHVIFVSHSMGGLVVRRYLLTKHEMGKVPMLYFYATPANGSELTELASRLSTNKQLKAMLPYEGNDFLQTIHDEWVSWPAARDLPSFCAYETMPTYGLWVVPQSSAEALCNRSSDPMSADHITIVKPPGRDDPRYTRFATSMRNTLSDIEAAKSKK
jgi:pimeloyl-ACP methyl ester carboxylesterase